MKKFLILVSAGLMLAGCAGTPKEKKIMNIKEIVPAMRKAGYTAVMDDFGTQEVRNGYTVRVTRYSKYAYNSASAKLWNKTRKYGAEMKIARGPGYVMAVTPKYNLTVMGTGMKKIAEPMLKEIASAPSKREMTAKLKSLGGTYSVSSSLMIAKKKKVQSVDYTCTVYPTAEEARKHKGIREGRTVVTMDSSSREAVKEVKKILNYTD